MHVSHNLSNYPGCSAAIMSNPSTTLCLNDQPRRIREHGPCPAQRDADRIGLPEVDVDALAQLRIVGDEAGIQPG